MVSAVETCIFLAVIISGSSTNGQVWHVLALWFLTAVFKFGMCKPSVFSAVSATVGLSL